MRTALCLTLVARLGLSSRTIQRRERSSCGACSYSCGPICTSTGASRSTYGAQVLPPDQRPPLLSCQASGYLNAIEIRFPEYAQASPRYECLMSVETGH